MVIWSRTIGAVATLTTFAIALPGSPLLAYVVLGVIVGVESSGVPVPGETTLFLGAFAAHEGQLSIVAVIAVAAAGAIVGDNLGYLFGRRLGRQFLERPGRFEKHRREALERGDEFFEHHGSKAVFLGRWITGLRVWASWLAGITHLPWPRFLFWNALGGICWATTVGLAGYFAGHAADAHVHEAVRALREQVARQHERARVGVAGREIRQVDQHAAAAREAEHAVHLQLPVAERVEDRSVALGEALDHHSVRDRVVGAVARRYPRARVWDEPQPATQLAFLVAHERVDPPGPRGLALEVPERGRERVGAEVLRHAERVREDAVVAEQL